MKQAIQKAKECVERSDMFHPDFQLVSQALLSAVEELKGARNALQSYAWQNAEYDTDIMSDGKEATDAIASIDKFLEGE